MGGTLKVAVVGCGIGRQHLDAYRSLPELFEVAAVCDVDETKAREVAAAYGIGRAVTDVAALCQEDDLDIVDLCTPPYLHAPQILQALDAGKHVICEKPLCGSLEDADRLAAAEIRSGRRVMPIFQYRFGHGIQKLRLLVEQGIAGRAYLTTVETAWRRRPAYYAVPWRSRWATELGGPLVNLAIHAHDLVYYLLGPARSVSAHLTTLVNPIETEDCLAASMEMADGSLCTLAATTGSTREISRHRFCFASLSAESNTEPYRNTHDPWTFKGDTPEVRRSPPGGPGRLRARARGVCRTVRPVPPRAPVRSRAPGHSRGRPRVDRAHHGHLPCRADAGAGQVAPRGRPPPLPRVAAHRPRLTAPRAR